MSQALASRKRAEVAEADSTSPQPLKRQRLSSESEEQVRGCGSRGQAWRVANDTCRVDDTTTPLPATSPRPQALFRHSKHVERPGIPNPIRLSHFRLPDKPSPPLRGDDKVCARAAGAAAARCRRGAAADAAATLCPPPALTAYAAAPRRRATMCTSWGRTSAVDVRTGGRECGSASARASAAAAAAAHGHACSRMHVCSRV